MADYKVLLIENDLLDRRLTRSLLSSDGYDVVEARADASSSDIATTEKPDIILVDTDEAAGLDVARRLKEIPALRDTPIIAIVTQVTLEDTRRARTAGCAGAMQKRYSFPYTFVKPSTYLRTLQTFVETSHRRKAETNAGGLEEAEAKTQEAFARAFTELNQGYPDGAVLELSDGRVCMVLHQNDGLPMRPVVKVLIDAAGDHPDAPATIDLKDNTGLSVKHMVGAGQTMI